MTVISWPSTGDAPATAPEPGARYWAFLSYSHTDLRCARWLHAALERYRVPPRLHGRPTPMGPAPRRLRPIFRDRDELSAGSDLGERLTEALRSSAYLIVICSPAAARSSWVDEEIRCFRALHGDDRILLVIAAGVPFASDAPGQAELECFPRLLRLRRATSAASGHPRVEPVAADLRAGKDGRRLALLKLISGMLRIDLDEVVQRDTHRRHRLLSLITAASLAGSAGMGALAITAINERNEALSQRAHAEGLIEFMIGDLRKTLEPAGRLDALDAIGGRALAYYSDQRNRGLDAESLGRRARVLQVLGVVREQRGELPEASRFFEESSKATAELLARDPKNPQRVFAHAQSRFYRGEVAFQRGDDSAARASFLEYKRLADRLVELEPQKEAWWAEVAAADTNLGAVLLREGRPDDAVRYIGQALAIDERVAREAPRNRDQQWDLAQINAFLADAQAARGDLDAALAGRMRAAAIYAGLIERSPGDAASAVALAANRAAIAKVRMSSGATAGAIADLEAALADMNRLMAGAPDNASYRANAAPILLLLARALYQVGDLDGADRVARRVLDMSEAATRASVARKDKAIAWSGVRLGSARVLAMEIAATRARSVPDRQKALQPAPAEAARLASLAAAHPLNVALSRAAAEASLLAGDYAARTGDAAGAARWWAAAEAAIRQANAISPARADLTEPMTRQIALRLKSRPDLTGAQSADKAKPAASDHWMSGKTANYTWWRSY